MVERVGGYYREPFCRERGVTQGEPLLTTILNVLVEAVVCHWEYLVAERDGGYSSDDDAEQTTGRTIRARDKRRRRTEEVHKRLKVKTAFLYADDGMVASTDPGWLKTAFDMLTGIFDQAGLKTNGKKNVGMVYHP